LKLSGKESKEKRGRNPLSARSRSGEQIRLRNSKRLKIPLNSLDEKGITEEW
jgi:hypothetical protein